MRRTIAATTGVLIVTMAVVGCSSTPAATHPPKAAKVETGQTNERVYSEPDLTHILNAVNTALALGGTVVAGETATDGSLNAIDVELRLPGTRFVPASCAVFAASDGRNLLASSSPAPVSAILSSSKFNLVLSSPGGANLPSSFTSGFEAAANSTLAQCKTVTAKVVAKGAASTITITTIPIPASVGADATIGFKESAAVVGAGSGAGRSSWTTVEAIDGNLELFVSGVSDHDVASLDEALQVAVNAATD